MKGSEEEDKEMERRNGDKEKLCKVYEVILTENVGDKGDEITPES